MKTLSTSLAALLALIVTPGCIHEEIITMRPEYAFPQNMASLCGRPWSLSLRNAGKFAAADFTSQDDGLLLSSNLLPFPPDMQRHFEYMVLEVDKDAHVEAAVIDDEGTRFAHRIPPESTTCNELGEFILTYPDESFYFWASLGNKSRSLALWTNSGGDLIVQNRWSETQRGVVSGKVSADAWATFRHADLEHLRTRDGGRLEDAANTGKKIESCESLSGAYAVEGQVVAADGRLDRRTAAAHFFREEIVGADAVKKGDPEPTKLELLQDESNAVRIHLYDEEGLLASRLLPAEDIACVRGKWEYDGDVQAHSPWLLMAASGGVYWENLSLWRDRKGDLLVNGTYKSKAVLLLIPFGQTETIFVAFARLQE